MKNFTIIEVREEGTDHGFLYHTTVIHVAASCSISAGVKWRIWAKARADYGTLEAVYVAQQSEGPVASCATGRSETLTLEQYEAWQRAATRPHSDGGEKHPAAWRKLPVGV